MLPDLEIIPHCHGYSRLLTLQLSSLIQFPPHCRVLYRACVTAEDLPTIATLDFFRSKLPSTVTLEPHVMDRRRLMRRCIGRNEVFLSSMAPLLWAADVDYVCTADCLEKILNAFPAGAKLAHPAKVHATSWPDGMAMIESVTDPRVVPIDLAVFNQTKRMRGIGGIQFVSGDYARTAGYCNDEMSSRRMRPADRWQPTRCDRKFRLKAGEDLAMPITALYRVRHDVRSEGNAVDVRL